MTVLAQDPALRLAGRPVSSPVAVPADRLEPGPRSHRFHVVDLDTATGAAYSPTVLTEDGGWTYRDRFVDVSTADVYDSFDFHAQNVYAVAARTLAVFEQHLGRRVPWGFDAPQLYLVPHAFIDANAYYSKEDHAVLFGYLPPSDSSDPVYACLSHDIVAHELTHAVLDGLRPRYIEPGLPDQLAYHEALADIVAILSVLAAEELVAAVLRANAGGQAAVDVPVANLTPDRLRSSVLLALAEQLGTAVHRGRADALRRSLETIEPGGGWRERGAFRLPHRRGEVVVAAVLTAFLAMWDERLDPYRRAPLVDVSRVAEEGARAAEHLLGMVVRATDYLPPVELEFEDVVDAILAADEVVAPDDRHRYRASVAQGFATYDIRPTDRRAINVSDLTELPRYSMLNRVMLQSSAEEVFRFIWQNPRLVDVDLRHYLGVERVLATRRTGPDGLVVDEIVADYIQMLDTTAEQLGHLEIAAPDGLASDTPVQLLGGGVLIFDQFGRLRTQVSKPLLDAERQTSRLAYLVSEGLTDSRGRFGFSALSGRGERFANLHRSLSDEAW